MSQRTECAESTSEGDQCLAHRTGFVRQWITFPKSASGRTRRPGAPDRVHVHWTRRMRTLHIRDFWLKITGPYCSRSGGSWDLDLQRLLWLQQLLQRATKTWRSGGQSKEGPKQIALMRPTVGVRWYNGPVCGPAEDKFLAFLQRPSWLFGAINRPHSQPPQTLKHRKSK